MLLPAQPHLLEVGAMSAYFCPELITELWSLQVLPRDLVFQMQRSHGYSISGGAQGPAAWGHGQTELVHDLAAGNPAHGWWLDGWMGFKVPSKRSHCMILWFYHQQKGWQHHWCPLHAEGCDFVHVEAVHLTLHALHRYALLRVSEGYLRGKAGARSFL